MFDTNEKNINLSRRQFLASGLALGIVTAGGLQDGFAKDLQLNGKMSPSKAFSLARKHQVELVDIRRPSEWKQTGVGSGAHRISMHEDGFVSNIDKLVGGDRTKPIALICARGVRSARMKAGLNAIGFTNVIDVSEGMLGSASGPGWLKRDLPLQ